jgi:hypothetical protein
VQFDPDFEVENQHALGVLRQAAEPFTTRDIVRQLLVERALDNSEHFAVDDKADRRCLAGPA